MDWLTVGIGVIMIAHLILKWGFGLFQDVHRHGEGLQCLRAR